ncbi:aminotransferase class III-fold pyridoxal phosphate-dependent enzyme [Simkania negevensis]|uniref:Aminotransferase class III-fold pyridoxal phosphate-dependent enzyme n=1 Tax=Simkania negevensis TaxID=83561 RepID=A0ABS3AQC3_9BACT|nr:aminotransferase class III-fold pyridoxal phosphate-dependent enzyme [Simkania negevensis]
MSKEECSVKDGCLAFDALKADPRIKEAKRLLLDAVSDHQSKLSRVQSSHPALQKRYKQQLEHFGTLRGRDLLFPYIGSGLGNGALVELADGSVKYDFICGIGVHFGHSHPLLVEGAFDAALTNLIMQGNLQQNNESLYLIDLLTKQTHLDHCFLTSSGAMACENALKVLFANKAPASRILAFDGCFMGRTLALSQITDKPGYRKGLPLNLGIDYIPFFDYRDPKGSRTRAIEALNQHIDRYPGKHACMCFELIQGECGYFPGDTDFFLSLMEILKEKGIAVFVDEIQTFGRTTELFAYQHFGLESYIDVVTVGKLLQTCATLYRKEFNPPAGLLSQTFTASTAAIHASIAIIKELTSGKYLGEDGIINTLGKHFISNIKKLQKKHPTKISGPFGLGTMIAFTPFNGSPEKTMQLAHALFNNGVITLPAGQSPARMRFHLPIGSVSEKEIDEVSTIIDKTLQAME